MARRAPRAVLGKTAEPIGYYTDEFDADNEPLRSTGQEKLPQVGR